MKKIKKSIVWYFEIPVITILVLLTSSCQQGLLPSEYLDYFEANRTSFSKIIERNGIKATICYYPSCYYSARDMKFDNTLTCDSAIMRYKKSLNFVVSIVDTRRKTGSVLLERNGAVGFKENVYKKTFGMEQNVCLISSDDTINALSCNYERNWGLNNEDIFVITFSTGQLTKKLNKYILRIREITPELGTVDIPVKYIVKKVPILQGK